MRVGPRGGFFWSLDLQLLNPRGFRALSSTQGPAPAAIPHHPERTRVAQSRQQPLPGGGASPGPADGSHRPVSSTGQRRTGLPRPPLPPRPGRATPLGRRIPAATAAATAPLAPVAARGQPPRGGAGRGGGGAARGGRRAAVGPVEGAAGRQRAHRQGNRGRRTGGGGGGADVGGKLSNNSSDAGRRGAAASAVRLRGLRACFYLCGGAPRWRGRRGERRGQLRPGGGGGGRRRSRRRWEGARRAVSPSA